MTLLKCPKELDFLIFPEDFHWSSSLYSQVDFVPLHSSCYISLGTYNNQVGSVLYCWYQLCFYSTEELQLLLVP